MTETVKAFSTEGFDFLGTLSTISQGAGFAFVAGGALTDKGRQLVSGVLNSIKIPPSLHAEVTFGASLVLLGTAYGINQNLNLVGNWYFEQAQEHEHKGEFSQAFTTYNRALNFSPDDYKTKIAIGFLYERLGDFDKAIEAYQKGTAYGIPEFLNAQARAMLMGELKKNNWQGGIDQKIIDEANDLLERADKTTSDYSRSSLSELKQNQRLSTDILINQAIAKMAGIKFEEKINDKTRIAMNKVAHLLRYIKLSEKEESEKSTSLTTASTLGKTRGECFHEKSFYIRSLSNKSGRDGIDYLVQARNESFACSPFRFDSRLYTTPDAFLLRKYHFPGSSLNQDFSSKLEIKDVQSLMEFIYQYPVADKIKLPTYTNRVILIQEPQVWLSLAKQLSQLIQKNSLQGDSKDKKKIVWRFLMSKEGKIIAYFAYDADGATTMAETLPHSGLPYLVC